MDVKLVVMTHKKKQRKRGTGGQVNRMSDDLISRKAVLDRFRYGDKESESDKAWICAVRRMIKEQPTAFDREKVIEQLNEVADWHGVYDGEYSIELNDAIEIVEKGGIE